MDGTKNFVLGKFLKMVQNGPIYEVITIKAIFEDIFIFFQAVGHPGLTLDKFVDFNIKCS